MIDFFVIGLAGTIAIIFIFNFYNRRYKRFAKKYYPDNYKNYSLYPVGWCFIIKADPKLDAECKKLTARFLFIAYAIIALIYLLLYLI
jgi:hypothetical protein